MVVITFFYRTGVPFDAEYYYQKHLVWVSMHLKERGLTQVNIHHYVPPYPYQVIGNLYFNSMDSLQNALDSSFGKAALQDISNFYSLPPEYSIGTVSGLTL